MRGFAERIDPGSHGRKRHPELETIWRSSLGILAHQAVEECGARARQPRDITGVLSFPFFSMNTRFS